MIDSIASAEGRYEYVYIALCDLCHISSITIYSHVPLNYMQLSSIIVEGGWIDDNEFDEFRCLKCDIKNYWINQRFETILKL